MYIQPIANNNITMRAKYEPPKKSWKIFKKKVGQKMLDIFPTVDFKNPSNNIKKINNRLILPAENRAILGGTAIILQPIIDSSNKNVDEKTRKTSVCRTIAKIAVGTLVGVIIRGASYNIVKQMTNINGTKKISKVLIPKSFLNGNNKEVALENYRCALSNFFAILAMLYTNFAIDAPLTTKFTNYLTKKVNNKDANKETYKNQKEAIYG